MGISKYILLAGYAAFSNCSVISTSQQEQRSLPNPEEKILLDKKKLPLEKVLLIGIDGLRPDGLQKANTPNIDTLVANGAYSFAAKTGEYTISLPSWSCIFTGVWENKHHVFANPGENVEINADFENYPSFFTRAKQYQPELYTVGLGGWDSVNSYIVRSLDKKILHPYNAMENTAASDRAITHDAVNILTKENPDLTFVYFLAADVAGHDHGFHPEVKEYIYAIEQVDLNIGQIMQAVKQRPNYQQEAWLTIVISDHGGKGKNHGDGGEDAKKVPFILHGPGIQKGEIIPPPSLVDVAPTTLTYIGIPLSSGWRLDGKVVGLKKIH